MINRKKSFMRIPPLTVLFCLWLDVYFNRQLTSLLDLRRFSFSFLLAKKFPWKSFKWEWMNEMWILFHDFRSICIAGLKWFRFIVVNFLFNFSVFIREAFVRLPQRQEGEVIFSRLPFTASKNGNITVYQCSCRSFCIEFCFHFSLSFSWNGTGSGVYVGCICSNVFQQNRINSISTRKATI